MGKPLKAVEGKSNRQDPIDLAVARFEQDFARAFGSDRILRASALPAYEVISTGSLVLDYATGVGGLVEGRLTEYWGVDDSGKSTFALFAAREALVKHPRSMVAWIDVEEKFDRRWSMTHGVDGDRVSIHPPQTAEDVADALRRYIASGLFSLVVVDSIGAMLTKTERDKKADEETVAGAAKIITRMVKIAAIEAKLTNTAVLLINQVRSPIGGFGRATQTTGGGWALRHATTMKMRFSSGEQIKASDVQVGQEIAIRVERNKVAPKGRIATVRLLTEPSVLGPTGIDLAAEAADLGIMTGVLESTTPGSSWYVLADGAKINGKKDVGEHLRAHPELITELRQKILATRAQEVIVDG